MIETSVIKLFLGAKEYFTTLTNTHGVTVKTDYILATKTINSPTGLAALTAGLGGLAELEQPGCQERIHHQVDDLIDQIRDLTAAAAIEPMH